MRKRVAFRALVILLASALLLTSTGAYNILVFADQNMEQSSLSATDEGAASMPSVSTYGGEMIVENGYAEPIEPRELETQSVSWVGDGTEQNPYQNNQHHETDANNNINNLSSSHNYLNPPE